MKATTSFGRSTGWESRWILIFLLSTAIAVTYILLIAPRSLTQEAVGTTFVPSGDVPGVPVIDTPTVVEHPTAVATVDPARASKYDVLPLVIAMNERYRRSLPDSFREGHVEAGPLLNAVTLKDDGFRINTQQPTLMATPSIAGGRLFVPGGFGSKVYYAFDLGTRRPIWTAELDDDGPSSAACSDSLIVFNTESCTMFVLDQRTGKQLWSHWLGDPLMSTPMIAGERVFTSYPAAAASDGPIRPDPNAMRPTHPYACFDLHKGTLLWQVWLDGDAMSTAVADESSVYLTTFPGTIYKIDQRTGRIEAAIGLHATSLPAIMGDELFVTKHADQDSTVQESIAVLDRASLGFLREFHTRSAPHLDQHVQSRSKLKRAAMAYDAGNGFAEGAPVSSGAYLAMGNIGLSNVSSLQSYMGSTIVPFDGLLYSLMGDSLLCMEPREGLVRWSLKIDADMIGEGGSAATAPIVSDAYVVTATIAGNVLICDRMTGAVRMERNTGKQVRYAPIMHKGWLYVPTTEGELACFDMKDPLIDGWPMLLRTADHRCAR